MRYRFSQVQCFKLAVVKGSHDQYRRVGTLIGNGTKCHARNSLSGQPGTGPCFAGIPTDEQTFGFPAGHDKIGVLGAEHHDLAE